MELATEIFTSISNLNSKVATLDIADRENLIYIIKFGLSLSVTQCINSCQILDDIYIDDFTIILDIELNLWVLNCLEIYKPKPTLILELMLEVFHNEFHRRVYTEFSRLDQYIIRTLINSYANQYLVNLIINKQLLT